MFDVAVIAVGLVFALVAHEIGHLAAARCYQVHVSRITVGFGPTLFARRDRFGTVWRLAALPLGASCRFENGARRSVPGKGKAKRFSDASLFQRAAIFAAGPIVSLLLGGGLITLAFAINAPAILLDEFHIPITPAFVIGGFSLALGMFNLLPAPPMDGAHLLLFALEAARRQQLSAKNEKWIFAAGGLLLTVFTTFILIAFVFAGANARWG